MTLSFNCRLLLQQPSSKASKPSQMPTAVQPALGSATSQPELMENALTVFAGKAFMLFCVIKCNSSPTCFG